MSEGWFLKAEFGHCLSGRGVHAPSTTSVAEGEKVNLELLYPHGKQSSKFKVQTSKFKVIIPNS